MTIRAVVFDVYGTLVRIGERRAPFRALLTRLEAAGRPRRAEDAALIMSRELDLADTAVLLGADPSAPELAASLDLASLQRDLGEELGSIRLFPETLAVMQALAARGLKLGLCSNLAAPYAAPVLRLLPFALDAYAWSFEVGAIKPDPAIYAEVCRRLGCQPAEVLFVGDTPEADLHGPRRYGMRSLLLRRDGLREGDDAADTIADLNGVLAALDAR
ncbi:HAD family hydrolase [Lysobacter sp. 5GHs7-4]|uniref:HAD family hydrolase n=1 Tax=Lysobacter sp. 5GHs7-4 TaxID=2904253 RepID=UPI001E2E0A49|nr:HAD family hydrolase [Lysobacter sp. 5GHs7-4]UHQ21515.1 HAD family hydrolase [Lysobacter sp. 5GHs7-4]